MRILVILRRFTTSGHSIFFPFWLAIRATFGLEACFVAISRNQVVPATEAAAGITQGQ
jgi:hypothetical protein